jgi:CheY-like chemotaxis protein
MTPHVQDEARRLVEQDALRVLLVDDDPSVLRACGSVLKHHGATVETAPNGKEAAERVKAHSFDVIVSDISMPEMTGIEFLKAVRAHDIDVPVILMTGEPTMESTARAIEYGARRVLSSHGVLGDRRSAIGERCDEAPKVEDLTKVGAYGF